MIKSIALILIVAIAVTLAAATKQQPQETVQTYQPNLEKLNNKVKILPIHQREYGLNNRVVYIMGVIDDSNSPAITKQLLSMGKDSSTITVIINSPGGSVLDGAQIISAMEAAKGPVNTLCVELCASMAAIIHSYGTNRLMINRSLVMFHPASGGLEGEVDKMSSRLGTLKRYIDKMDANVAKRAHITFEEFRQMYEVELWLDAEDAVQRQFADSVVFVKGSDSYKLYPEFSIRVKANVLPVAPVTKNPFKLNWF